MEKVAVFGLGRSGMSALKLAHRENSNIFVVNQGRVENWNDLDVIKSMVPGSNLLSQDDPNTAKTLAQMDKIILSPGIPRELDVLEESLRNNVPIINEIEYAYKFLKLPMVGVTGTNGKTTTVTLIGEILKNSGKIPFVGGNIGIPLCEMILDEKTQYDSCVLELSSFQLESTPSLRPLACSILNIYPNHGERYESVEDYTLAKINIMNLLEADNDVFVPDNDQSLLIHESKFKGNIVKLNLSNREALLRELSEYDLSKFKLLGTHNLANLLVAIKLSQKLGANHDGIQRTIDEFCGVEFRLEYLPTNFDFTVYNDAKSTNWDATLTAINSFNDRDNELILVLGGKLRGRGDSVTPYIERLKESCSKILLIGESGKELSSELEGHIEFEYVETIEGVLKSVVENSFKGDLLFSFAFPSFDQFQNYVKRGKHVKEVFVSKS